VRPVYVLKNPMHLEAGKKSEDESEDDSVVSMRKLSLLHKSV